MSHVTSNNDIDKANAEFKALKDSINNYLTDYLSDNFDNYYILGMVDMGKLQEIIDEHNIPINDKISSLNLTSGKYPSPFTQQKGDGILIHIVYNIDDNLSFNDKWYYSLEDIIRQHKISSIF